MSVGNLKDEGNKGNNFPYQLRNLQLLAAIAGNTSGFAPPAGGFATEVTSAAILAIVQKEGWTLITGNSMVISYFTAPDLAHNPSGATDNIKDIKYYTGAGLILTQTFTWNLVDDVVSIVAS